MAVYKIESENLYVSADKDSILLSNCELVRESDDDKYNLHFVPIDKNYPATVSIMNYRLDVQECFDWTGTWQYVR